MHRLGSDDVMIQAIGDQINLTNVSEIQPEGFKQPVLEAERNVSQDER